MKNGESEMMPDVRDILPTYLDALRARDSLRFFAITGLLLAIVVVMLWGHLALFVMLLIHAITAFWLSDSIMRYAFQLIKEQYAASKRGLRW